MPASNGHAFFPFRAEVSVFVHLHCHSHYSFLRGVASPGEIIAAAMEQKMSAVALTDTNGLYAAVTFYQAATKAGVKPIVGVALDVGFHISSDAFRNSKNETRNSTSMPLTLLAADMEGYSNLCQLVTLRHLGTTKLAQNAAAAEIDGRPVTLQELAEHSRGVIALCSVTSHESLVTSHQSPLTNHFSQLKEIFGDRLYIEVQHLSPGDGRVLREAERIGREFGVPLVA